MSEPNGDQAWKVPVFRYSMTTSLPQIRLHAFSTALCHRHGYICDVKTCPSPYLATVMKQAHLASAAPVLLPVAGA